ncbi:sorbosone dehydrogenase family protein [Amycolatopsis sp. cg5]|uniref:PQQ-dependent sugar dehydrogenase n=1 Tax=Amycolatopsis sp. cg5 TaxID=3238802 RepID=UPI003526948D
MSRSRPCLLAMLVTVLVTGLITPSAHADEQVLDPLPTPAVSGLGLTLKEIATLPKSEPVPAPTDSRLKRWNRINYLGELPDHSGRLYVPDLNGKLYFLKDGQQHVYLDVGAEAAGADFYTHKGLGSGFGFVAFDPRFAKNGRFYTIHTEAWGALTSKKPDLAYPEQQTAQGVLTEWTATDPKADVFSGTHREVLRLGFEGQLHGIQEIGFNPTAHWWDADYGLLYLAVGDGGVGTKNSVPQDLLMPQGKILRIDPRGTNSANGKYGIPRANPFVGKAGVLGEIYASGMRDPYRFSWDPAGWRHQMFLGHIGEKAVESVYEITPGANLGWSEREGPFLYKRGDPSCGVFPLPPDDAKFGYTYPVAAFDHNRLASQKPCADSGNALMGGFVYRGHKLDGLYGKYLFAEGVSGTVLYSDVRQMRIGAPLAKVQQLMLYNEAGKRVTMQELAGDPRVDLRFGQDQSGELYLTAKANGKIWKITGTRRFADCRVGHTEVSHATSARDWAPVTPAKWQFPGREVVLAQAGEQRPGPRRPFEYAVLTKGPVFGSVRIDAEVRLDTPVDIPNRDVIIVFGYQSDTQFYYAHLSQDNTIYPHNGIFAVNNADRLRIDDQWDAARSVGALPAVKDARWHDVEVTHCAATGEIAVYVDGSDAPLMTAIDPTFKSGRVGFGSFDNIGRLRDLTVTGTREK